MRKRDRVRLLAVDGRRVVAVIHDTDTEKVQAWCLWKYGPRIHVIAWKYASAEQRRAAALLPLTLIPQAWTSESVRAQMGRMTAGGGR
jgi:hypothetical protein